MTDLEFVIYWCFLLSFTKSVAKDSSSKFLEFLSRMFFSF